MRTGVGPEMPLKVDVISVSLGSSPSGDPHLVSPVFPPPPWGLGAFTMAQPARSLVLTLSQLLVTRESRDPGAGGRLRRQALGSRTGADGAFGVVQPQRRSS